MVEKLEQVRELTSELHSCGYHSFQVKNIIKDTIDTSLDKATEQELDLLISTLNDYISFAKKCKKI